MYKWDLSLISRRCKFSYLIYLKKNIIYYDKLSLNLNKKFAQQMQSIDDKVIKWVKDLLLIL